MSMGTRDCGTDTRQDTRLDEKGRPLAVVPAKVPWVALGVFVLVAGCLAWVACLPLWISGEGLKNMVAVQLCGQAMMLAPLVAVIAAMIVQRKRAKRRGIPQPGVARYLGIWPLRPARRVVGFTLLALFGTFVLVALAYFLSASFGWVRLDLAGLSGFKAQLGQLLPGVENLPIGLGIVIYLGLMVFSTLVTAIFTFGEEVGWRGWLLTSLRPLGTWPALIIVGVIWGLWHAPLILLGYNFGRPDISGLGLMVIGCVMVGILLGWLRMRTGSLWPAVFGHAAINGSSGMLLGLFIDANSPTPDMALVALLGAAGWILSAVVAIILVATGQFRRQPELSIGPPPPVIVTRTEADAPTAAETGDLATTYESSL